jgi:type I restriction enzyme S subunit
MISWKKYKIGKLVSHKKGFAFKSKHYLSKGIPIVRVSDLTENSIDLSSCLKVSEETSISLKQFALEKDDMIITTVGSWLYNPASVVGKIVKVPVEATGALLNQNAVRLRTVASVNQNFLYYRLKCEDFRDYIVAGAQGSANQAAITLDNIFSFEFQLPPLPTHTASLPSFLPSMIK